MRARKPLEFHPDAEGEYLEVLAWHKEISQNTAISSEGAFRRAIEMILGSPQRWPIQSLRLQKVQTSADSHSSSCMRLLRPTLSFWQSPMATRRPAYWKAVYDNDRLESKANVAVSSANDVA